MISIYHEDEQLFASSFDLDDSLALPWFRVHVLVLNDPGRLIAVHLVHTGLVSGWAASMAAFEAGRYDPTDSRFNPMWRQGMYVLPFMARLGVTSSWARWTVATPVSTSVSTFWTIEGVAVSYPRSTGRTDDLTPESSMRPSCSAYISCSTVDCLPRLWASRMTGHQISVWWLESIRPPMQ